MRFGITMDNLNLDNVQLDLDTLLRFVCAYALNDTHVSQNIIASSFESLPDQIKTFGLLVEFTPEKSDLLGINFTSISTEVSDKCIKNLSKFIDLFRKENVNKIEYPIIYDFFSASPFSYVIYFIRNVISSSKANNEFLKVNQHLTDLIVWIIENKADQLFLARLLFFIRHWQTISVYDSINVSEIKGILAYAKSNNIFPSF